MKLVEGFLDFAIKECVWEDVLLRTCIPHVFLNCPVLATVRNRKVEGREPAPKAYFETLGACNKCTNDSDKQRSL